MPFVKKGIDKATYISLRNTVWDMSPLFQQCEPPRPKIIMTCPVCGSKLLCLSEWRRWKQEPPRIPLDVEPLLWTVDVGMKCLLCGHKFWFGIRVTDDEAELIRRRCGTQKRWQDFGHICYSPEVESE